MKKITIFILLLIIVQLPGTAAMDKEQTDAWIALVRRKRPADQNARNSKPITINTATKKIETPCTCTCTWPKPPISCSNMKKPSSSAKKR